MVWRARLRRTLLFVLVLAWTGVATRTLTDVFAGNGLSAIEWAVLVLFALTFAWIAVFFWTAVVGFALKLRGKGVGLATPAPGHALGRTALIMPIYQEDVARVAAGLAAIYRSLARTGRLESFDLFLLSDTRDPQIALAEEAAWARLCSEVGGGGRIFYRRRADNKGRKSGNVAEFCERWGRRYEGMIVLDADSVMSGETCVRLAEMLAANPKVALIQTLPTPVNAETLFARVQQFASRLYGPLFATGMAWWQLGQAGYWGHNAIIRTSAFIEHCGLPTLPGREPFGGEILSHDFVEAALLSRAGYEVWLAPELGGSYEELPPNVLDFAKRDRRWCQGNLQHAPLLLAKGLRPMSRLNLLFGVMSYLASPMWLLMIVLGSVDAVRNELVEHSYFPEAGSLFPVWPVAKPVQLMTLFAVVMTMLFLPKLLALVLALRAREQRRGFGGAWRLSLSVLLETAYSVLLAPVMMLFQSRFVFNILRGGTVAWVTQQRAGRGLLWREALALHGGHTLLGLVYGALMLWLAPRFFWWLTPILLGMVVSVPLTVWSSRPGVGLAARRAGLFLIPEETAPPPELAALRQQCVLGQALEEPAAALPRVAAIR